MNLPDFHLLTDSAALHPALPPAVIWGLAGLAAVLTLVRAVRGKPLKPAAQAAAVLLRLGAIAILTLILLNPSQNVTLPQTASRTVLLLDDSASMTLAAADGKTRWEAAGDWAGQAGAAMTDASGTQCEVRLLSTPSAAAGSRETWPVPSAQETRLAAALEAIAGESGTRPPDQIVVVSDGGVHDRTRLSAALGSLRGAGVPVSSKLTGIAQAVRNAALTSVHPPRVARPGSRVVLPVNLSVSGFEAGGTLTLTLRDEAGAELARTDLTIPETGPEAAELQGRLSFDAAVRTARYHLELSGPAGEVTPDDNHFSFTIEIIAAKLRVLVVEGTHVKRSVGTTGHSLNDIELMTTAWDATGEIEWECLTPLSEYVDKPNLVGVKQFVNGEMLLDRTRTFPKTPEEIHRFDVMMISDVPVGNFSKEQMELVTDWVTERGGGFMMGGGYTSFDVGNYDRTPWEKIIPVDMLEYGDGFFEHPFAIAVPAAVRNHPIWQMSKDPEENARIIASHPQFTGMNRVRRAKPGALVLAVRPEADNEPVFAVQNYGRGRSIAYLSDPNGGWAKFTVGWGPPGGPVQGRHTELGHGEEFVFNEAAARSATGPRPPHPAPYYARFWVNVVKWLGDHSIRWRRDQFAGRVLPTQAAPGLELPVAAEVLTVTNAAALQAMDVGARLDAAGSPRVRLTWDRDQREFTGKVQVPADFQGEEVRVLFDTASGRGTLTDIATVGLRRESREFAAPAPDEALMRDVAAAGGGHFLTTPGEAADAAVAAVKARTGRDERQFLQPLWTQHFWWALLMGLLGLEWFIRRRHRAAAPVSATSNALPA